MSNTTTIKQFNTKNVKLLIQVVETHTGSNWLQELYTGTDEHEAGVTIQVPSHLQQRHGFKYYIGQYTPAELTKDYASQGRDNPSKGAYESLQNELGHYITADDCYLQAVVIVKNHRLGCVPGICFDYSHEYDDSTLEETALAMLKDYGREFVQEAVQEARESLNDLKSVA